MLKAGWTLGRTNLKKRLGNIFDGRARGHLFLYFPPDVSSILGCPIQYSRLICKERRRLIQVEHVTGRPLNQSPKLKKNTEIIEILFPPATLEAADRYISLLYQNIIFGDVVDELELETSEFRFEGAFLVLFLLFLLSLITVFQTKLLG